MRGQPTIDTYVIHVTVTNVTFLQCLYILYILENQWSAMYTQSSVAVRIGNVLFVRGVGGGACV